MRYVKIIICSIFKRKYTGSADRRDGNEKFEWINGVGKFSSWYFDE